MIRFTLNALNKLNSAKPPSDAARYLRLGVIGGGCSGYSYTMGWEETKGSLDKVFRYPIPPAASLAIEPQPALAHESMIQSLDVVVDPVSIMYLDGMTVGYGESLQQSGFTFDNPNAKKTCGCGSSFEA